MGFNALSIPCGVSGVEILGAAAGGELSEDGETVSDTSDIGNFVPATFIGGVNLRCGAVVAVIVTPDETDERALPEEADNTEPDVFVESYQ